MSFLGCLPFFKKTVRQAQEDPKPPQPEPKPLQIREVDPQPLTEDPPIAEGTPLIIPRGLLNILNPSVKEELKKFCKKNNLCIACSYPNPNNPTVLVFNGLVYECPHCDSDAESP
jgi:hypothetical protein